MPGSSRTHRSSDPVGTVGRVHHESNWERLFNGLTAISGLFMASASTNAPLPDDPDSTEPPPETLNYRQMFEGSLAVQLLIDPRDGSIFDANPAAAEFYGYPRDVLRTMHIQDINTLTPEEVQVEMEKAASKKKNYFQFQHRLASGEVRDVEVQSSPFELEGRTLLFSIIHDISDLVRADVALQASEIRLRAIFDQSLEFIGLLEPDGVITEINMTGLQLSGLTREDMIGKPLWEGDWWREDARPQIQAAVEAAARGETPRFEVELSGQHGQSAPVDFSIKPAFRDDGSVAMLIPEARDISSLKRAVNTLRETNQTLEAVVDSSPLPIVALDSTGIVTMWNPAAVATFWWEADEVLGRPLPLFGPENRDQIAAMLAAVLKGESVTNSEVHAFRKDTSPLILSISSSPMLDARGTIHGIILIAMDVTDRLTASHALARSEGQLRALFEAMPDVILVVDTKGICLRAAPTTASILAREVDEIVGTSLDSLFPPDETMRYEEFLHLASDAGQTIRVEYHTLLDQIDKWYTASITPMSGDELLWVARDVTDRKRSEMMQSALYRIASIAGLAEEMDSFYESLHEIVAELMYAHNFYIALAGPRPGTMHFPYFVDESEEPPTGEEPRSGLTGLVLDTGKPVLITDRNVREMVARGEISSVGPSAVDWMGVPLSAGEETFGVLAVQSYTPDVRFNEDDLELLTYVSRHISAAIDRKRAADAVRQSEERYRTLIETSPDAVFYMGIDRVLEVANPNAAQLLGFESDSEMVGVRTAELAMAEDPDRINLAVEELMGGEPLVHFESVVIRQDGSRFPADWSVSLMKDGDGQPQGFVVILRDITERWRIELAEKEQRELAEALRDTAAVLNSTLDLNELLDRVLENVERVVPHDAANVILLEDRIIRTVRWQGYIPEGITYDYLSMVAPVDDYPNMLRMMETHTPHIVPNTRSYAGWRQLDHLAWIASNICAPIVYQDQVLGFLNVDSKQEDFFTEDHARRLGAFADQVAVALQNTRLYDSERKQLALSQTLQEVGALLTSQLSLKEVLEHIFDLLGKVVTYDAVSFLRVTPEGNLEQVAARGYVEPEKARQFMEGQTVAGYEHFWSGRPIAVLRDTQKTGDWVIEDGVQYARSWIGAALRVKGELIGILNLDSFTPDTYDDSVSETVVAFANQAAIAIENARLYESEHRQRQIAEMISETTTAAVSSLDTGQVLLTLSRELQQISGAHMCTIFAWDSSAKRINPLAEYSSTARLNSPETYSLDEFPETLRVLTQGRVSIVNEALPKVDPAELQFMQRRGLVSMVVAPLRSGDQTIGLIEFGSTDRIISQEDPAVKEAVSLIAQAANWLPPSFPQEDQEFDQRLLILARQIAEIDMNTWCAISNWERDLHGVRSWATHSTLIWPSGTGEIADVSVRKAIQKSLKDGAMVIMRRHEADPSAQEWFVDRGLAMIAVTPIMIKGETLGVVGFGFVSEEKQIAASEEQVWQLVINQAAIALENARLYESEQHQRQIAELISETTTAAVSSLDTGQVLLTMATRLRDISGFTACGIYDWDSATKQFRSVAEQGRILWQGREGPNFPLSEYPVTQRVLQTGTPALVYAGSPDAHESELAYMQIYGLHTMAMFPLRSGDTVIGMVELGGTHGPRNLSDERFGAVTARLDQAAAELPSILSSVDQDTLVTLAHDLIQTGAGQWCTISTFLQDQTIMETLLEYSDLVWEPDEAASYGEEDYPGSARAVTSGEIGISRLSELPPDDAEACYLREAALGMIVHIPITSHGVVIGLVELSDLDSETVVTEADLQLWRVIVDQTAIALENARLYESEHRQRRAAEIISATTTAAVSSLNPGEVMLTLASRIRDLAEAHTCTIFEWDQDHNRLRAVTEHSNAVAFGLVETYKLADYPATEQVLNTGEPSYYDRLDPHGDGAEKNLMLQRGFYSLIMLPLRSGDQIVGLVEIARTVPCHDPPTMIKHAANLLAAAADRVPPTLRDDPHDEQSVLLALAREVVHSGIGSWCAISSWLRDAPVVQTCADYSEMLWESEMGPTYNLGEESAARQVVEQGETVILRLGDPGLSKTDAARLKVWGWQMVILMPILIKGDVIGMLELGHKTQDQMITEPNQQLWRVVVDQAAVALENARLFTQSQERNQQLALLNEITRIGTEVLKVGELLQTLVESAQAIIGGTESYITLWDEQHQLVIPAAAYGAERDTFPELPPFPVSDRTLTRAVLESGKPVAISNVSNHPALDPKIAVVHPSQSLLGLPMIVDGGWLGAVLIGFTHPHHFTDDEIQWAMQAVELIGLAIAKAQAYEEMEHRIELRTAELTTANERMQVLSRIRDEFVSNVSHELRTPITSIKLHHHLMNLRPENSEVYMERLIRETARLEHIVSDLLRLSELDRGNLDLILIPTDIQGIAQNLITDRTLLAENQGLKLRYASSGKLPPVAVDSKLIGQCVSILLTNAISYTPSGGKIEVRTSQQSHDGSDWVVISVSDTGPGISPEDQAQLFTRFFRGQTGRTSDAPGTGLGLAIAQEIVHRHHGRIEAISEGVEGKGSTFSIWLPVSQPKDGKSAG